ncbi:MAG TPA: hypothetical protein VJ695_08245 [Nitrososphaera sp.]|nr:hypothetical protein [Nitrososphaera sp.]
MMSQYEDGIKNRRESLFIETTDAIKLNSLNTTLYSMTREQFDTCPKCGIGKMKPTGGATSTTSADPETKRVTGDYREYKCDNCGYPEGGQAKVARVREEQEGLEESMNSSNIDHKNNQPF